MATTAPTHRARLWRRRLTRAALCILLGAVTTVGIAWGVCAAEWPGEDGRWWYVVEVGSTDVTLDYSEFVGWGWTRRSFGQSAALHVQEPAWSAASGGLVDSPDALHRAAVITMDDERLSTNGWMQTPLARRAVSGGWGRVQHETEVVSFASGWPYRVMWGTYDRSYAPNVFGLVGARLPQFQGYPYLPILPGVLLDTLFYAVPWWALLVTPGLVKRWRRKRRGACVSCGYDLRGLGEDASCPECGQATRVAVRRRPALSDDC